MSDMHDYLQQLSPAERDKLGERAGRLVLARALADVMYAVRVNLPPEQVGKKMEELCDALDGYIDYRISGQLLDWLKEMMPTAPTQP